jgi:DNA-binding response OmpR family regulator
MARVLIVLDSLEACDALRRSLDEAGHAAECHPDGRAALVAAMMHRPDAAVLDFAAATLDCAEFLQVARTRLRMDALAVVVVLSAEDAAAAERARRLGADAVLAGVATPSQIVDAVDAAIARRSRRGRPGRAEGA